MHTKSKLIQGGIHVDKRGVLRFCNEFDIGAVKRFYTISNSKVSGDHVQGTDLVAFFFDVLSVVKWESY